MGYQLRSRTIFLLVSLVMVFTLAVPAALVSQAEPPPQEGTAADASGARVRSSSAPTLQASLAGVLDIPSSNPQVTVDGTCLGTEYNNGVTKTFTDGGGGQGVVFLIANADTLFVCMQAKTGSYVTRYGTVYLDLQGDGGNYPYANQGDDAFRVEITGKTKSSYSGNGLPNGWTPNPNLDGVWDGASTATANGESVEWEIKIGAAGIGNACGIFGLSVFHQNYASLGDDYHWLDSSVFDQPRTWQLARIASQNCPGGDIAYIFRGNTVDAVSFYNLLVSAGYGVDLIPLADVMTANLTPYTMIVVADDTGQLNQWGTPTPPTESAAQVNKLKSLNIPILGLGEGGYAFFGRLPSFLGWPNGWHGPQDVMNKATTAVGSAIFTGLVPPVTYMTSPLNSVGIYINPNQTLPADVTVIGLENPLDDHATILSQDCRTLWGNGGNPLGMNADGKTLFLRTVAYTHALKCGIPTIPPPGCVLVSKTAVPATGITVTPGTVITYTIQYTLAVGCGGPQNAKLVDTIPANTVYVPNSASDGISPGPDGVLSWLVSQGTNLTKTFQVTVSETACSDGSAITNTAMLLASGYAPVTSAVVSHPASCQPVVFPNHNPMFAEDELTIEPYPLVAGHASEVRVSLNNLSASPQPVTVQFQTSPGKLGIGLAYTTFATRAATLPPHSNLILRTDYIPALSGLACFEVTVTGSGLSSPLMTQSCIDNIEDFSTLTTGDLIIPVENPTGTPANITLVVDNTCPGWSATIVTDPAGGVLNSVGANHSETRTATLHVVRPTPATLGSGCHIDVQGWIGSVMIGGVRKLDIPPVHLPSNIQPPWEEREIVFLPDPPVAGVPGQVCVELSNPLGSDKTVTVAFDEADFGAGIAFTPLGEQTFNVPAHSFGRYCINWTPSGTGTVHRCILVHLRQSGYAEMHSQRNVDIVRTTGAGIGSISIPVTIGNPDLVKHALGFDFHVTGIDPYWMPVIEDNLGGPAPETIPAGGTLHLFLRFHPAVSGTKILAAPSNYQFGSESQVSVGVLFDGAPASGFTVMLETLHVYLPVTLK